MLRLLAVVFLASALTCHAQDHQLLPVDEGLADPTWVRFRTQLLDALSRRDAKFVTGIVDKSIRNISGISGAAEFRKHWEPQAADSPLWVQLPKLLFLGSTYVKRDKGANELCAPYVHFNWPDNAPPGASGAIIAKESLLKAAPSAASTTSRTLSYHLVHVLDWEVDDTDKGNRQKWVKIQVGPATGFVPEEEIRSPLEYRACFVKAGAGWRMTGLESGE